MKPEKRSKTITVEYWTCGIEKHHHTTEAIARKCIATQARPRRTTNKWGDAELRELGRMRRSGMTLRAIAKHYGVAAPGHIAYLFAKLERLERREAATSSPET